ncbi:MAG: phosphotransferase [Anaerolineae bacterium]
MTGDDVARILAYYDLGECQDYWRVSHGYVNENWIIRTATGRYFLKRRHPDLSKPDLVAAQHALVQHLRSVHFPAPTIVPTRRGRTFLEFQDHICEIHDFIPGDLCNPARLAHFATAARTLGYYHNAVRGFDHHVFHRPHERYGPASLTQIIDRLVESWHDRMSPELDLLIGELREHARDLQARFSEFGQLPELVIHGDYYADNLIFQGDELVGVVDYDLAHWCSRVLEVAEALIYFAAERPGQLKHIVYPGVLDLDAAYQFLLAYTETASLSESEIHALPHLIRAIWLCASLDPPLEPLLRLEAAPQALPEILTLAGWAEAHTSDIVDIGLAARAK